MTTKLVSPRDCIFFQLATTSRTAIRFLASRLAELDLTPTQGMVMGFLCREDRITSRQLGERTNLDSATLTGLLDRLEAMGVVERQKHPEDRRAILICLTDKGRALAERLGEVIEGANREFLAGLGPEAEASFRSVLKELAR